jgi:hypothetical protein
MICEHKVLSNGYASLTSWNQSVAGSISKWRHGIWMLMVSNTFQRNSFSGTGGYGWIMLDHSFAL